MKFNEIELPGLYLFQTTLANPSMQWLIGRVVDRTDDGFVFEHAIGLQINQEGSARPFPFNPFSEEELEMKDRHFLTVVEAPKQFQDAYRELTSKVQIASADMINGANMNTRPNKKDQFRG